MITMLRIKMVATNTYIIRMVILLIFVMESYYKVILKSAGNTSMRFEEMIRRELAQPDGTLRPETLAQIAALKAANPALYVEKGP